MTKHDGVTVVARVLPQGKRALERLLHVVDKQVRGGVSPQIAMLPFSTIGTLHFARFVLVEDELVFVTSFDGSKSSHLRDLAELLTIGLDQIFRNCEGYSNYTGSVSRRLVRFLEDHDHGLETHFVGGIGLSVRRIKSGERLRHAASVHLEDIRKRMPAAEPAFVFDEIKKRVKPRSRDHSTLERVTGVIDGGVYYAGGFAKLALAAALLPAVLSFYPALWQKEWRDAKRLEFEAEHRTLSQRAAERRRDDAHIAAMEKADSKFVARGSVQKALTHVVRLKPGLTRAVALRVALAYVAYRSKYWDVDGQLAGIDSIHFARWVPMTEGRLLFLSDYDGSWESYLGDFVDEGASGLSAVWSNGEDFPKTRDLIAEGARDERGFKRWVRTYQIETQVWYSAYPKLTMRRILDNERLRKGFEMTKPSREEAEQWLALV